MAKTKKVLTDKDITIAGKKIPTDKEMKAEMDKAIRQEAAKGAPRLARGVAARDARHSAKAVSDGAAKAAKEAKPAKAAKKAAAKKVAKAPAKTAATDDKRKIVVTTKGKAQLEKDADNGSTRNLKALAAAKNVPGALAAGLKMADINYAAKVGTITLN